MTQAPTNNKPKPAYEYTDGKVPVFFLVPAVEKTKCAELLVDVLQHFASEPPVHTELKAARLPPDSVVYIAHVITERKKRSDGTFGPVDELAVSKPIKLADHSKKSTDGYSWEMNFSTLLDEITQRCLSTKAGKVYICTLSGDPQASDKLIKIQAT